MKWYVLIPLLILAGCGKDDVPCTADFTHTGCAKTKAVSMEDPPSLLTLRYDGEGLAIIRTGAYMNCSIATGGLSCDFSVEGDTIHYRVYETEGKTLKCLCLVERMASTVVGLKMDAEYILEYECDGAYYPINFHYDKDLDIELDIEKYRKP